MIVITCQHQNRRTNGKTKGGAIRYRCRDCGKSWTESTAALDGMRIGMELATKIVALLCEGMSARATARLTNTDVHTVIDLMNLVGERCDAYMQANIKGVHVEDIQCDELWSFVLCKQSTAKQLHYVGGCGDCYCFTAIERSTKLVVAWHMGKRTRAACRLFDRKPQHPSLRYHELEDRKRGMHRPASASRTPHGIQRTLEIHGRLPTCAKINSSSAVGQWPLTSNTSACRTSRTQEHFATHSLTSLVRHFRCGCHGSGISSASGGWSNSPVIATQ
jgi:transposase-like protein